VVALRPYCALGEILDGGFELLHGFVEEVEAVVESSLFEFVETRELLSETAAVGGGQCDLVYGVVHDRTYHFWDGF